MEEVDEVCDEVGRYSNAGLAGDFDESDELEYCLSVSNVNFIHRRKIP
jgi:hypothetical protein